MRQAITAKAMGRLRGTLALAALGLSCNKPAPVGTPTDAAPNSLGSAHRSDAGSPKNATANLELSWATAVRLGLWDEASRQLDALPESESSQPRMRYLRGVVAVETHQPDKALDLLREAEKALPQLHTEIEALIAESLFATGRHLEAATLLSRKADAESLLKAAYAYRRAERIDEAKATVLRAFSTIKQAPRSQRRNLEVRARALRAKLSRESPSPATALSDLRWLALEATTHAEALDAADALEALDGGKFRLTAKERYLRAMAFAREGMVTETERELGLVAAAPGPEPTAAQKVHAQGWAWYLSRSDYLEAARLLSAAAAMGGTDAVRNRFYAARALARAQRDADAIRQLKALVKDAPQTSWAEQALFLIARLHYVLGQWKEAAAAFDAYLKRYGSVSDFGKTAKYSKAVALLAATNYEQSAVLFGELVDREAHAGRRERYRELLGVALLGKEDTAGARREFETVIRNGPLSFPAIAARARLETMGIASPDQPPAVAPQNTAPPQDGGRIQSVELPPKAALLSAIGLDEAAEDAIEAEESSLAKSFAPREAEALCLAYGKLWTAARRFQVGQRTVGWGSMDAALSSDNQWLWECNYPAPYSPLIRQFEEQRNIPRWLTYALMRQESAFRAKVRSPVGAVGLMQLMPNTALKVAAEIGVEHTIQRLETPAHNINLGTAYLAKLLTLFRGNVALAVPAYNAGPRAVSHWLESGETLALDLFVARIPYTETRNYTYLVLENFARYRYLASAGKGVVALKLDLPTGMRAGEDAY